MTVIYNDPDFAFEKDRMRGNALRLLNEVRKREDVSENISVRVDRKTILFVSKAKYNNLGKKEIIRRYKCTRFRNHN